MRREVNLLKMFLIVPIIIVAVLSFFPCIESESHRTTFCNAKWIVFTISVIEIGLLFIENRWTNDLYKVLSVIIFLVTLLCPVYYMVIHTGFGINPYYQHNSIGVLVLIISVIPYVGFKIYEIVKKRNSRSV